MTDPATNARAYQDRLGAGDAAVTQADRDAAATFIRRDGASKIDESVARMYERGERDDQPLAQLLARHRLAAERSTEARLAGEREVLRDALADLEKCATPVAVRRANRHTMVGDDDRAYSCPRRPGKGFVRMSEEMQLTVSFSDQSESFVLGFETGRIAQRMDDGECKIDLGWETGFPVHTANVEVLRRFAQHHGYIVEFRECGMEGWTACQFSCGSAAPKFSVV